VQAGAAAWLTGEGVEAAPDALYVSFAQRVHEATRALSCMAVPEAGDDGGLQRTAHGRLFVTAVLARTRAAPLTLDARHGLVVKTAADIRLEAGQAMHLQGTAFTGRFDDAHWAARLLRVTGAELVLRSKAARLFAQAAEAVLSRLPVSADRSYRHV